MDWKYKTRKATPGSALNWEIYFPPGLATWAGENIESLLGEIKLPNQPEIKLRTFTEKLKLENANAHQVAYLFEYCHYIRDIRLVIGKTEDWVNTSAETEAEMQRVVVAALPFAKSLLKKDRSISDQKLLKALHGSYYEKEITVTLSLFGDPAYIRGVKASFPTSASVPEDMAHALIKYTKQFSNWDPKIETLLYLPFAGTGTFGTEWEIMERNSPTHIFPRDDIFTHLTIYPEKTIAYYLNLHHNKFEKEETIQLWLDTDPALAAYYQNEKKNWEKTFKAHCNWHMETADFFKIKDPLLQIPHKLFHKDGFGIFMPINPPFGFRKKEINTKDDSLYFDIGKHIQTLAEEFKKFKLSPVTQFAGFLLCPTEEKWLQVRNQLKGFHLKTIHVTHGGIDLRVLFFHHKN